MNKNPMHNYRLVVQTEFLIETDDPTVAIKEATSVIHSLNDIGFRQSNKAIRSKAPHAIILRGWHGKVPQVPDVTWWKDVVIPDVE
jgi:hypothetical protein